MAEVIWFNATFGASICTFTHNNISYTRSSGQSVIYEHASASPTIGMNRLAVQAATNPGQNVTVTAELKVGNNTTGQKTFVRSNNTTFELAIASVPNSVAVPLSNGDVTCQLIIRVNGTVVTTNNFLIPAPSYVTVSSVSPSPVTGKICTGTFSRTLPSPWKFHDYIIVAGYLQSPAYRKSVYGYKTDETSVINYQTSALNQFTFYLPYDSSIQKNSDQGLIKYGFDCSLSGYSEYYESGQGLFNINVEYTFTWSYVDQTDAATAPIVTLNPIVENPSGMLATYGKYVGGGIGKLTFSIASITYKFGAKFSSRTVSLYNSDGTLNKSWTYSNTNSFTLSLTNTTDGAWYIVISITDTAGRTGSATTAVFQAYGYEAPTIISLAASRCNQDGTPNDSGEYCKITWYYKIYALGDHNSKKNTLNAPDGTHVYTNIDYDRSSRGYSITVAADTETSYQIDLTVEDDFDAVTQTMNLSTAGVIMDFLYNGKGIGLGKVAETSNMVEVNPEWTFKAQTIVIRGQDLATILQSLGYTFPT